MEARTEPCVHSAHNSLSILTDLTEHWLPSPQVGREMSDSQPQLDISWRSHQQSNCQEFWGQFRQPEKQALFSIWRGQKVMETEKSYSILSFNWKEENLLKKKLSFLEAMKIHEANARLMEQKAFYKRCYSKRQRSELAHARLLGNKELVKQLTSKSMFSNYSTTMVDNCEAAVKAIVKNRRGTENNMLFQLGLNKEQLYPACRSGVMKVDTQEAPRVTVKADSKEEGTRATVKIRMFPSRHDSKSALILSLEQGAQQRKLPVDRSPPPQDEEGILSDYSRHSNTVQSDLKYPTTDRESKGKFLKYIVHGNKSVEHPKKKRPRPKNNLHDPEDVQMNPALLTEIQAILRQEFLLNEAANLVERVTSPPYLTHFLFQDSFSKTPLKKESEGALHAPGIRRHTSGRGPVLEEIGNNSITTKNVHLFS